MVLNAHSARERDMAQSTPVVSHCAGGTRSDEDDPGKDWLSSRKATMRGVERSTCIRGSRGRVRRTIEGLLRAC